MLRILVADDSVLFREGLVRLLTEAGHEVVAAVGDATAVVEAAKLDRPDLAIIDVRMPPTMTEDGTAAAEHLRKLHSGLPILLLSQHVETRHTTELVGNGAFGYLLKDRVLHVEEFLDAVARVAAGGSALDPSVVAALVSPKRHTDEFSTLTQREHEVLALVAEGLTNNAAALRLFVSERTIEAHMRSVFLKLGLHNTEDSHRRVLSVIAYLNR